VPPVRGTRSPPSPPPIHPQPPRPGAAQGTTPGPPPGPHTPPCEPTTGQGAAPTPSDTATAATPGAASPSAPAAPPAEPRPQPGSPATPQPLQVLTHPRDHIPHRRHHQRIVMPTRGRNRNPPPLLAPDLRRRFRARLPRPGERIPHPSRPPVHLRLVVLAHHPLAMGRPLPHPLTGTDLQPAPLLALS